MRRPPHGDWKPHAGDRLLPTQGSLDFDAHVRHTDPITAARAAGDVDGAALAGRVLAWLRERGTQGGTSHECSEALGLSLVTASPRFAPLARAGLIVQARMADSWPIRRKVEGQRCSSQVWVAREFAPGGGG